MKLFISLICIIGFITGCDRGEPEDVSFSNDIKPILNRSCTPCHNRARPQGNIDLSSYEALMESQYFTRREPIVLPENARDSRLYIVITTRREGLRMPPEDSDFRRVSNRNAERIRVWIEEGAENN